MDRTTIPPQVDWVKRALWLAWATILYNVVEGLVAVGFGAAEESMALLGFGLDSWIEVASAVVVLWRLRGETGGTGLLDRAKEKRATQVIGVLLLLLGVAIAAGAVLQVATGRHPGTTLPGLIISLVSLSFMVFLWRAKLAAAAALDSRTLLMDAACSRSCIQLSAVLLAGSLLFVLAPALWWADAAAALVLAVLVGREGWETFQAARKPDFNGGCGCSSCGH